MLPMAPYILYSREQAGDISTYWKFYLSILNEFSNLEFQFIEVSTERMRSRLIDRPLSLLGLSSTKTHLSTIHMMLPEKKKTN